MSKRRPPPTSLILPLRTVPLPPRRQPKYTLPSPPPPTFYRQSSVSPSLLSRSDDGNLSRLLAQAQFASDEQRQRLHDTYDYEGNNNNNGGNGRQLYHFSTSPPVSAPSHYNPLALNQTQSPIKKPARAGLPSQWLDPSTDGRSLSPNNNSDFSSSGGSPPMGHLSATASNTTPLASATPTPNPDDEIIPTAIVIKNIPFNVKRETLLDIIASLAIPTPYAFNYHLDQQGSFRGLAFANFRQAADADAVVAALNGFDVQGRKLRVEYKKVLQAGEKERIEREKAIRRMRSMQLEKEHSSASALQQQYDDYGSLNSTTPVFSAQRSFSASSYQQSHYSPPSASPMPVQSYSSIASAPAAPPAPPTPTASDRVTANELDLNDPSTLEIYSRILLFKDDRMRDELAFSRTLTPKQRRVVHLIAQKLGVYHYSVGEGEERYAVVTRIDPQRQQPTPRHTLSRAPSAYLTPSISQAPLSLRAKKSMPDMKTLHSLAPRLNSRSSNGNIREGFATLATPTRRISAGFGSLFGNGGSVFGSSGAGGSSSSGGGGGSIPPVPSLPNSAVSINGGHDSPSAAVVRQPRGPGVGGFGMRRDTRAVASESHARGAGGSGLDAQTHEPLEF